MKKNSITIAQFTYDGDGKRVIAVENGQTTVFVGAHYEKTGAQITKYYGVYPEWKRRAGAQRAASRTCSGTTCADPVYYLTDHLGSTSLTTKASGDKIAELRYTACPTPFHFGGASLGRSPLRVPVRVYLGQYANRLHLVRSPP